MAVGGAVGIAEGYTAGAGVGAGAGFGGGDGVVRGGAALRGLPPGLTVTFAGSLTVTFWGSGASSSRLGAFAASHIDAWWRRRRALCCRNPAWSSYNFFMFIVCKPTPPKHV